LESLLEKAICVSTGGICGSYVEELRKLKENLFDLALMRHILRHILALLIEDFSA
jgi:hypothetical protein